MTHHINRTKLFDKLPPLQTLFSLEEASTSEPISALLQLEDKTVCAVAYDAVLIIFERLGTEWENIAEVEFDFFVEAIVWETYGKFIVLAQGNGTISFVTREGAVLFSHKIISRPDVDGSVALLRFFSNDPTESSPTCTSHSLVCLTKLGVVAILEKIPVDVLLALKSATPQMIGKAMQKIKFQKRNISVSGNIIKSDIFQNPFTGTYYCVALTSYHVINVFDLTNDAEIPCPTTCAVLWDCPECIDFGIISQSSAAAHFLFVLFSNIICLYDITNPFQATVLSAIGVENTTGIAISWLLPHEATSVRRGLFDDITAPSGATLLAMKTECNPLSRSNTELHWFEVIYTQASGRPQPQGTLLDLGRTADALRTGPDSSLGGAVPSHTLSRSFSTPSILLHASALDGLVTGFGPSERVIEFAYGVLRGLTTQPTLDASCSSISAAEVAGHLLGLLTYTNIMHPVSAAGMGSSLGMAACVSEEREGSAAADDDGERILSMEKSTPSRIDDVKYCRNLSVKDIDQVREWVIAAVGEAHRQWEESDVTGVLEMVLHLEYPVQGFVQRAVECAELALHAIRKLPDVPVSRHSAGDALSCGQLMKILSVARRLSWIPPAAASPVTSVDRLAFEPQSSCFCSHDDGDDDDDDDDDDEVVVDAGCGSVDKREFKKEEGRGIIDQRRRTEDLFRRRVLALLQADQSPWISCARAGYLRDASILHRTLGYGFSTAERGLTSLAGLVGVPVTSVDADEFLRWVQTDILTALPLLQDLSSYGHDGNGNGDGDGDQDEASRRHLSMVVNEYMQRIDIEHQVDHWARAIQESSSCHEARDETSAPHPRHSPHEKAAKLRTYLAARLYSPAMLQQAVCDASAEVQFVVCVSTELCRRVLVYEQLHTSPFQALLLAERAYSIAAIATGIVDPVKPVGNTAIFTSIDKVEKVEEEEKEGSVAAQVTLENILGRMKVLRQNLRVQAAVWRVWGYYATLEMVYDKGLQGLVFDRLWVLDEENIEDDITTRVVPLMRSFAMDLDAMLALWVRDAVSSRKIFNTHDQVMLSKSAGASVTENRFSRSDSEQSSDGDEDDNRGDDNRDRHDSSTKRLRPAAGCNTVELSRLITVVKSISNPQTQASVVLVLFQVRGVDSPTGYCYHRPSPSHQREKLIGLDVSLEGMRQDDDDTNVTSASVDESATSVDNDAEGEYESCADQLISIARGVIDRIDLSSQECLAEALRLHRIKCLAASYGVIGLDPRDSSQIRAAANLIAARVDSSRAIPDAVELVEAWSTGGFNISSLITRGIVSRAIDTASTFHDESERDKALVQALSQVPVARQTVVVEDTCTTLLGMLESLSAALVTTWQHQPQPRRRQAATSIDDHDISSEKDLALLLCRSVVCVVSWYLDECRSLNFDTHALPHTANATGGVNNRVKISRGEQEHRAGPGAGVGLPAIDDLSSWVTAPLLASLKKIRALQLSFGIYLSLDQFQDVAVCRAVAAALAEKRATELVASTNQPSKLSNRGQQLPQSGYHEAASSCDQEALTVELRRASTLLGVSHVMLAHTVLKSLLSKNAVELALHVAQSLSAEYGTSSSYEQPSSHDAATSSLQASRDQDSALLVDAAVTLCALAARQVFTASAASASTSNAAQYRGGAGGGVGAGASAILTAQERSLSTSFSISRSILRGTAVSCPAALLGKDLDLLCASDLVLTVLQRTEGAFDSGDKTAIVGVGAGATGGGGGTSALGSVREADSSGCWGTFKTGDDHFSRDGILMSPSTVLAPLMKFSLKEVQRRSAFFSPMASATSASGEVLTAAVQLYPVDMEDLVGLLQRSENHMLASRVLLSSWHHSEAKAQALRSSILPLSRNILSYRVMDSSLAVACLALLPYKTMVKELRAAVPSIQTDFSRLQTLAFVGQELAHMWNNEDNLLEVFDSIEARARWLDIFSSCGVQIDMKTFQASSDARQEASKRNVRALLEKMPTLSGLEKARDYCLQFELQPEFASLYYIELLLLHPPAAAHLTPGLSHHARVHHSPTQDSPSWLRQILQVSGNVTSISLLETFSRVLHSINALDYDKIEYVCQQLTAHADGERSKETCDESAMEESTIDGKRAQETAPSDQQRKYEAIILLVNILGTVHFPPQVLTDANSFLAPFYADGFGAPYTSRLPLWPLLEDPWAVIDCVMETAPHLVGALLPLCGVLDISPVEFSTRRIKATYARVCADLKTHVAASLKQTSDGVSAGKVDALEDVRSELQAIADPLERVEVWRWIYEEETGRDDAAALVALQAALGILAILTKERVQEKEAIDQNRGRRAVEKGASEDGDDADHFEGRDGDESDDRAECLQAELTFELVKLRCQCALKPLQSSACVYNNGTAGSSAGAGAARTSTATAMSTSARGRRSEEREQKEEEEEEHIGIDKDDVTQLISQPAALLKRVLEGVVTMAWQKQLRCLRAFAPVLAASDLLLHSHTPAVSTFLGYTAASVLQDLQQHCQLLETPGDVSARESTHTHDDVENTRNVGTSGMRAGAGVTEATAEKKTAVASAAVVNTALEKVRYNLIVVGLSDIEALSSTSGGPSSAPGAGLGLATPTLSSRDGSRSGFGTGTAGQHSRSLWGAHAHGDASSLQCTASELRRREDVYLGFTVSTLVACCRDESHRQLYVNHLEAVMRGKGGAGLGRAMRRVTGGRSRFRAALALHYLGYPYNSSSTLPSTSSSSSSTSVLEAGDTNKLRHYLFCLCELQQTRLLCSEEALADAVGYTMSSLAALTASGADPRPLVRTWLRDEGDRCEAVELARDVLFVSGLVGGAGKGMNEPYRRVVSVSHDVQIWELLLTHMVQNGYLRSLIQTILLLRSSPLLSKICSKEDALSVELVRAAARYSLDVVEKAEQMMEILRSRGGEEAAADCSSDSTDSHGADDHPGPRGGGHSSSGSTDRSGLGKSMANLSISGIHGYSASTTAGASKREASTSSAAAADKMTSRPVLVGRCCYSDGAWDSQQPPEEVSLCLQQVAALWNVVLPYLPTTIRTSSRTGTGTGTDTGTGTGTDTQQSGVGVVEQVLVSEGTSMSALCCRLMAVAVQPVISLAVAAALSDGSSSRLSRHSASGATVGGINRTKTVEEMLRRQCETCAIVMLNSFTEYHTSSPIAVEVAGHRLLQLAVETILQAGSSPRTATSKDSSSTAGGVMGQDGAGAVPSKASSRVSRFASSSSSSSSSSSKAAGHRGDVVPVKRSASAAAVDAMAANDSLAGHGDGAKSFSSERRLHSQMGHALLWRFLCGCVVEQGKEQLSAVLNHAARLSTQLPPTLSISGADVVRRRLEHGMKSGAVAVGSRPTHKEAALDTSTEWLVALLEWAAREWSQRADAQRACRELLAWVRGHDSECDGTISTSAVIAEKLGVKEQASLRMAAQMMLGAP